MSDVIDIFTDRVDPHTNAANDPNAVVEIFIPGPVGATGPTGPQGIDGKDGATGPAGTTTWAGITDKPSTFPPSTHASSHLAGGSDSLLASPGEIGGTTPATDVTADKFSVDTSSPGTVSAPGEIAWNDTDGTLDLRLKGNNTTLQLGQETVLYVKNDDTVQLLDGTVVYVYGASGSNLLVRRAKANAESTSAATIGVVTEPIAANGHGYITTFGNVRGLNTQSFNEGDILYLSPATDGLLTNVKPVAPNHMVMIGFVVKKSSGSGEIFVQVQNGYELEELHDVLITDESGGQVIRRSADNTVWENYDLTPADIGAATAEQGALAASAVQPGSNATFNRVIAPAFYTDIFPYNSPNSLDQDGLTLRQGNNSIRYECNHASNIGAVVLNSPTTSGTVATVETTATLAQGAKADTAVQPTGTNSVVLEASVGVLPKYGLAVPLSSATNTYTPSPSAPYDWAVPSVRWASVDCTNVTRLFLPATASLYDRVSVTAAKAGGTEVKVGVGTISLGTITGAAEYEYRIYQGNLTWRSGATSVPNGTVQIKADVATDDRTLQLPNATGTLALTSDIPTTFAASAITSGTLDNARINWAAPSAIGGTTAAAGTFTSLSGTSLSVAAGTLTASAPFDFSQTWNNSGVTFTGLKFNVTDTASAAASLFLDLQIGGSPKAQFTKLGSMLVYNTYTSSTNYERGFFKWASNVLQIGTEKGSGGGTARALEFQTDGTTRVSVSTTGNVGVGTQSPSNLLDVVGSSTGAVRISVTNSNGAGECVQQAVNNSGKISLTGIYGSTKSAYGGIASGDSFLYGNGNAVTIAADGAFIKLCTGGSPSTEKMRILTSGEVGIGNTDPAELLDVNSSAVRIRSSRTPASATATGNAGTICWDSNYLYVCVDTNTWKRAVLASW